MNFSNLTLIMGQNLIGKSIEIDLSLSLKGEREEYYLAVGRSKSWLEVESEVDGDMLVMSDIDNWVTYILDAKHASFLDVPVVNSLLAQIYTGVAIECGSVVVVEYPEIYLSSISQSRLAEFYSYLVRERKLRVILETHSEHLVNGIRKEIVKGFLDSEDFVINYFWRDIREILTVKVEPIKVNNLGEFNKSFDGFMDQEEKDLFELRRLRNKKKKGEV